MSDLLGQVSWQIDDSNGLEWALFHANTAANAQFFADKSNFGLWSDVNAKLSHTINWARALTFLLALFWLAAIVIHYRYAGQLIGHF